MKPCFVDTFCFLAMLNPRDEDHARATRLVYALRRPLVTTTWVLTEVADALAHTGARHLFGRLLTDLQADPRAVIVPTTDALFEQGSRLYAERPDKRWSLTDCISFVVMERESITEALTADHHFEQAGFVALLR